MISGFAKNMSNNNKKLITKHEGVLRDLAVSDIGSEPSPTKIKMMQLIFKTEKLFEAEKIAKLYKIYKGHNTPNFEKYIESF
jgi:hypothetical protein